MEVKVRNSSFELLRILCMIMIVILHTLGHGGALNNLDINSGNFFIANLLESLSIVAVNCYILISGFFGINSEFKLKKVVTLYIQVMFYSIFISLIFWGNNIEKLDLNGIVSTAFPITMQTWWFMSVFLVLYLFTPYVNKLLKSISKKDFHNLLFILILVFIIWPSLPKFRPIDNQGGYSLYSFLLLYIVGAYISLYHKEKSLNKYTLISIYILSSILLCVFNVTISRIVGYNWGWYSYNFILIFISSLSLFLFFKEINIKNTVINKVGSLTLGIYLIHDHGYVRSFIYDALNYSNNFDNSFIPYTLIIVITIFIGCAIIEYLRQFLFNAVKQYRIKLKVKSKVSY